MCNNGNQNKYASIILAIPAITSYHYIYLAENVPHASYAIWNLWYTIVGSADKSLLPAALTSIVKQKL